MDFKEVGLSLLGSVIVNAQTLTKQVIFTVPVDKTMIALAIGAGTPTASLAGLVDLDLGGNALADDWIQQVTLAAFTAITDFGFIMQPEQAAGPPIVPVKKSIYAAGVPFGVIINTGSTGAANVTLDLFGYLF